MTDTNLSKPGGRPRAFDAEAGVDAAVRLFWERGYDGVGVAELARTIGINPPSLYAAYGSKLGLFRKAVERYGATTGAFFGGLGDDAPFAEVIGRVLADAVEAYTGDPACKGCLIMDGTRNCTEPEAREVTGGIRAALRQTLAGLARSHGVAAPEAVSDYVLFILTGLSASARDGAGREELVRDLERAMAGLGEAIGGTTPRFR